MSQGTSETGSSRRSAVRNVLAVLDEERALSTYGSANVARSQLRGGVVLRDAGPWSHSVISLLRHLESVGFAGAPRAVGNGFAEDGREAVTYVPGSSAHPQAWPDQTVAEIGALLRDMHDATASFELGGGAVWKPWFGRELAGSHPVIGHCDTGPWNIVVQNDGQIVLIDWEFAGPVDVMWELAQAAWLNVQLHDDDIAERMQLPAAEPRAKQLRVFADGYGLAKPERDSLVETMITFAVLDAREESILHDVGPESSAAIDDAGNPVLWGITWRTRSAAWMLKNRKLLERALN